MHDLFVAGTESTSSMLYWAILCLLHYPETQKKLRNEILHVLGKYIFKINQNIIMIDISSDMSDLSSDMMTKYHTELLGWIESSVAFLPGILLLITLVNKF